MKRRETLKAMGAGIIGLPALDYLGRRVSSKREVVVNIYQNKDLTRQIKLSQIEAEENTLDVSGKGPSSVVEDIAKTETKDAEEIELTKTEMTSKASRRAIEKFDAYFDNIDFKLKFGDFDVPIELGIYNNDLDSELGYLKDWMKYTDLETPKSDESNILIVPSNIFEGNSGIATTPIIPKVSIYEGHGIVWCNPRKPESLKRIIAHEVGHTIGLQHFHGSKLDEDHGSLMYSRKYAKNVGRNIYGESLKPLPSKNKFRFNPEISADSLRI